MAGSLSNAISFGITTADADVLSMSFRYLRCARKLISQFLASLRPDTFDINISPRPFISSPPSLSAISPSIICTLLITHHSLLIAHCSLLLTLCFFSQSLIKFLYYSVSQVQGWLCINDNVYIKVSQDH